MRTLASKGPGRSGEKIPPPGPVNPRPEGGAQSPDVDLADVDAQPTDEDDAEDHGAELGYRREGDARASPTRTRPGHGILLVREEDPDSK